MNKILVVGGTGFIGSHIIKDLLDKKYDVYSISHKKRKIENKANFLFLDLSKKINESLIKKFNPEVVIYTASLNHTDAESKFNFGHKVGYLSIINLLNSKNIKKNLKKIIFLSTAQVYKDYCKDDIDINSDIDPKSAYSLFHIQSENYLRYYSKKNNIDVICLRISNGYGEPIFRKTNCWSIVVNDLCLQAFKNKRMQINSNPNVSRNFIYVRDISKEILINIKKKVSKNFLIKNIGSNKNIKIKDVSNIIKNTYKKLLNINIQIDYKNKTSEKIKIYNYKTNNYLEDKHLTKFSDGIFNLIRFIISKNGKV